MPHESPKPIDTVRLSDQNKQHLIDEMDRAARATAQTGRQRLMRVAYRARNITVHINHPSGGLSTNAVTPRNLSAQGVAFIHGTFVYPQNRCTVELVGLGDQKVQVKGEIISCRHVRGQVHEVGVRFDKPIDLRQFVTLSPEACHHSHHELDQLNKSKTQKEPAKELELIGRVLLVDANPASRKIINMWLSRLGLVVIEARDLDDAQQRLQKQAFNLLLIDATSKYLEGLTLIEQLRQSGRHSVRAIVMSSDESGRVVQAADAAGADVFLKKPIDADMLKRTILELMDQDSEADFANETIHSTLANDPDMLPLLTDFVFQLGQELTEIEQAIRDGRLDAVGNLCHALKGSGGSYGLYPVSDAAEAVIRTLSTNPPDIEAIQQQVDALASIIERIDVP